MTDDTPDIRRDAKYYNRHLIAFYAGLTPVFIALLYSGFYIQSFVWFLIVSLAGFLATFAITMYILPYPICATCGRTVRQRPLGIHAETGSPSYYCSACDIRWIVEELHKPYNETGARLRRGQIRDSGLRHLRQVGKLTFGGFASVPGVRLCRDFLACNVRMRPVDAVRKLQSGNLLLVKHGPIDQRTHRELLTAYISTDDAVTWSGGLMLDER